MLSTISSSVDRPVNGADDKINGGNAKGKDKRKSCALCETEENISSQSVCSESKSGFKAEFIEKIIIIANTNKIIHGSKVLILGFGRIGKVLARKLAGLSAKVTCAARKDEDLAWIRAYGHMETNINAIGENLSEYDVIINTVPHLVLTSEKIKYVKDDCLLVDLASNPGGIDKKAAKDKNLKLIWALALPGKVAPVTTAEFIKDTVYNILKEIYKK